MIIIRSNVVLQCIIENDIDGNIMFFKNTSGGTYEFSQYGKLGSYTFPRSASFNLHGIELDISGLKVDCYGGKFDMKSNEYLTKTASKICSSSSNVINSDIFIEDNSISGYGYPGPDTFRKYAIPYISSDDFVKLQNRVRSLDCMHPDVFKHKITAEMFQQWAKDSSKIIKQQLNDLLNQNNKYPKQVSLIYDDRKLKHTTHIVLEFLSKDNCTLKIDNTISLLNILPPKVISSVESTYKVNLEEATESFSKLKPNFIKFHLKQAIGGIHDIELEMSEPISQILYHQYDRMHFMLKEKLQVPIQSVQINTFKLNQKRTLECVPFSIQNKINLFSSHVEEMEVSVLDMAIRIRAEQAILAYLLNGNVSIPRFDEEESACAKVPYTTDERWYPNFPQVCEQINQNLSDLPVEALQKILLAMELDGPSIAYSFKPFLLKNLKSKLDMSAYQELPFTPSSVERAQDIEATLAPTVIYQQQTHTFFLRKPHNEEINLSELQLALT